MAANMAIPQQAQDNWVTNDWMYDEPTVAEAERDTRIREHVVRTHAELVRDALPASGVLVVMRGSGLPTGIELGSVTADLDPVLLAEILLLGNDDHAVAAAAQLVLGGDDPIEHAVARLADGSVCAVIAVRLAGRVATAWLRAVLSRAADALAAWLSPEPPHIPSSVLDAIDAPVVVHDSSTVLLANQALADMLGRDPIDVPGIPVRRITHRFSVARTCSLNVGGAPRCAVILDPGGQVSRTPLAACVERVIARHYSLIRRTARLAISSEDDLVLPIPASAIEEIATAALLDAAAAFSGPSSSNRITIRSYRHEKRAALEVMAAGDLLREVEHEPIGTAVCVARVNRVGGSCLIDTSNRDRRMVRALLPVVS